MKRKSFLQTSAAVIGGSLLPYSLLGNEGFNPKKTLRFAFISDIHVKPGEIPEAGMAKMLQHVQQQKGIDFIINGGDAIMDSMEASKEDTQVQWDLFHRIMNKENNLPVFNCIGNHDVWGWFIKENKPENDPLYGKGWVVQTQQMKDRYYSFDKGNWHFIVLDSTQLNPAGGYVGQIDPGQLEWLEKELESVDRDRFICIVSHIPILSMCAGLFFGKTEENGDLVTKRNLMHMDSFTLKKLFIQYPNIKACLSGHVHLQDHVNYLGIDYYCNGATCGNWWKGAFQEFAPAYAIFELKDDGTLKRTMINYE